MLSGEFRRLALASWDIDRGVLAPRLPPGTELDEWNGRVFVSLVGLEFRRMRAFGVPIPVAGDFEGVNFRFYVRRRVGSAWIHGAVFLRNFVGRRIVAAAARTLYGENVDAARIEPFGGPAGVGYRWRHGSASGEMLLEGLAGPAVPAEGSLERFLTDRPRGFVRRRGRPTRTYAIEHPAWRVRPAAASLRCDAGRLYGEEFAGVLSDSPAAAFVAEGSAIRIAAPSRVEASGIESRS